MIGVTLVKMWLSTTDVVIILLGEFPLGGELVVLSGPRLHYEHWLKSGHLMMCDRCNSVVVSEAKAAVG